MASRKNKWRKRGALEFKRETKRYSDGTPWGHDVLFVRIKGKACAIVEPCDFASLPSRTISVLCGTWRIVRPTQAPKLIREYLVSPR
jgi:hypothetical protein